MKMAGQRRRAQGARRGDRRRGSSHGAPVHRRRVAAGGARHDRRPLAERDRDLGRPARRGDRDHRRGRPLRRALRRGAGGALARRRALARARVARARLGRADPAGQPLGQGDRADAADAARGARARPRRRGDADAPAAAPRARPRRPPARRHGVGGRARDDLGAGPRAARRGRVRPRARPPGIVLQAYLRDSPAQLDRLLDWSRRASAATLPSSSAWSRAPTGTTRWSRRASTAGARRCSSSKADCDRNFEAPHPAAARRAARWSGSRSARTTCARSPTRSPTTASRGAATPTSSSRCSAASATTSPRRCAPSRLRVRSYCPVGDLVAGMAYLVRRLLENTSNDSFLSSHATGRPARGAARRAVTVRRSEAKPSRAAVEAPNFTNEPTWSCGAPTPAQAWSRRSPSSTAGCRSGSRS